MKLAIRIIFAGWIIGITVFAIGQVAYNHYLVDQLNMIVDTINAR